MHEAHEFLKALTIVLGVAALTTVLFQRLRQPVVLGYIIAGLIVGPHVPVPLVADATVVQTLSELGVILLMFSLGLEFSIRKLVQVAPTAGPTAVVQSSIMVWLGFVAGRLFGWTMLESLFTGAIVAISSTTIIAKAFDEQGIRGKLRELVVGVLIVEDLIAILLMALLTALATGSGLSAGPLAATIGRLAGFLVALVGIGMLIVPRVVRAINRLDRRETTLVATIGICFGIALLAQTAGYSVALGAFIAGSLVAESGDEQRIVHIVEPVRDMFAAVFFVSVGMQLDPGIVAEHWRAVTALTLLVVFGKLFGVSLGAFLSGSGMRTAVQAGLSLAQIGEFSFIIGGLGLALGATRDFLYPVAIAVSGITTLLTPVLMRVSGPAAAWIDHVLPKPLQTFTTLYGTWFEELRARPAAKTAMGNVRRLIRLLLLDGVAVACIVIATAASMRIIVAFGQDHGISAGPARVVVLVAAAALAAPFCIGLVRVGRRLGLAVARMALPAHTSRAVDFAAAPRRALVVTLQLLALLLVGLPLLALTQPFVPGVPGAALLAIALGALGVAFWRSATNLQGHVRAGAQVIVEALAAQSRTGEKFAGVESLERVHQLLPGLGTLVAIRLPADSHAVGQTLAELNLRGLTGATVLAITRSGEGGKGPGAAGAAGAGKAA